MKKEDGTMYDVVEDRRNSYQAKKMTISRPVVFGIWCKKFMFREDICGSVTSVGQIIIGIWVRKRSVS